jgi:hypothetical protein
MTPYSSIVGQAAYKSEKNTLLQNSSNIGLENKLTHINISDLKNSFNKDLKESLKALKEYISIIINAHGASIVVKILVVRKRDLLCEVYFEGDNLKAAFPKEISKKYHLKAGDYFYWTPDPDRGVTTVDCSPIKINKLSKKRESLIKKFRNEAL